MNTFMRIPTMMGMAFIVGGLVACGNPSANLPQTDATPSSLPIPPTAPAATSGWADILEPAAAPVGWQVVPCDNPALLCVTANGELIGTVERFSYPLDEIDLAATVEPSPGNELAYLRAWVAEHYAAIERDRQIADVALTFTSEPPTELSVGGLPGLRYRFTATRANGGLFDRYVGYVTTDGLYLHVFVTGIINGDPSGTFSDNAALVQFEPYLEDIIQGLLLSEQTARFQPSLSGHG